MRGGQLPGGLAPALVSGERRTWGTLPLCLTRKPPFPPPPFPHCTLPLAGFNGNQSALWTATNSTGNSFLINVHGTSNVVVGDVSIPAFTPVESEWFCDGFSALLGEQ